MKRSVAALSAFMLLGVASAASAQTTTATTQACHALLDTRIAPISFSDAVQQLSSVSIKKDEFETTAAFQARLAAAREGMPASLAISVDLDKSQVTYDADAAKFVISSYAFRQHNIDWFSAFYQSDSGIEASISTPVGMITSFSETPTGTYEGQNAYGAKWDIVKIDRHVDAIYQGAAPRYDIGVFGIQGSPAISWDLPVPAENARAAKEAMRAAVVIAPSAPFFFENTQDASGRITIQNPRDITQTARVIVADIQCVVITDQTNYVFVAIPTV